MEVYWQPILLSFVCSLAMAAWLIEERDITLDIPDAVFSWLYAFAVLVVVLASAPPQLLSWTLADFIVYLSQPTLDLFRIFCVMLIGTLLFAMLAGLLFLARRR